MNYSFLTTKEFTNTKTYVIGMLTAITWISFLVVEVVQAILQERPTFDDQVQQKLRLASLGFNAGIVRSIMEYFKNSFHVWKFVEKQKKERNSVIDMSDWVVREER